MGEEIKIFVTEREIDGHLYGEQICAHNFTEAEEVARKFGAKVLGTLEGSQCADCGKRFNHKPQLAPDEWPDEVG